MGIDRFSRTVRFDGHTVTIRLCTLRSPSGGLLFEVQWWRLPERFPPELIRAFDAVRVRAIAEMTAEFTAALKVAIER